MYDPSMSQEGDYYTIDELKAKVDRHLFDAMLEYGFTEYVDLDHLSLIPVHSARVGGGVTSRSSASSSSSPPSPPAARHCYATS